MKQIIPKHKQPIKRRKFLSGLMLSCTTALLPKLISAETKSKLKEWIIIEDYNAKDHLWGMGIDINKFI